MIIMLCYVIYYMVVVMFKFRWKKEIELCVFIYKLVVVFAVNVVT